MHHIFKYYLGFIFLLLAGINLYAHKPIFFKNRTQSANITNGFYLFNEEEGAKLSIKDVIAKNKFIPTNTKVPAFFASFAGHWVKIPIQVDSSDYYFLELGSLSFDELNLYIQKPNGTIDSLAFLNWKTPHYLRDTRSEFFGYKFFLEKNKIYNLFLRGYNYKGTFRIPIKIATNLGFEQRIKEHERFFGIFLGVFVFIFALGFAFFILSKDKSYLYYVLSVIFLLLQSFGLNGYLSNQLLGFWPAAADPTFCNLFICGFAFFHIKFMKILLLDLYKTPAWVFKYINFVLGLCVFLAFFMLACLVYGPLFKPMSYVVYVLYIAIIGNYIITLNQGFKYNKENAYFISLSMAPFFIYLLYLILTNVRILKQNSPYNIVMWCMMFDNIVLCIGLAFRFNILAKKEVILQKEINEQLNITMKMERQAQQAQVQKLEAQYKLELEKQRISRDLHDNIGSQLTYISSTMEFYANKFSSENLKIKMDHLNDDVRGTIQQLRDTIWAINKENVSLYEMGRRLAILGNKLFENEGNVTINLNVEPAIGEIILSTNQALNLFRIGQEVLNNCKKYANATIINIDFHKNSQSLLMSIKDNGKGFDPISISEFSFGLKNIQTRAIEMKGSCQIESVLNYGTEIKVVCPLD